MRLKLTDLSPSRMLFERHGSGYEGPSRSIARPPERIAAEITALLAGSFSGSGVIISSPILSDAAFQRMHFDYLDWTTFDITNGQPMLPSPYSLVVVCGDIVKIIPRCREALLMATGEVRDAELVLTENVETQLNAWVDGTSTNSDHRSDSSFLHSLVFSNAPILSVTADYEYLEISALQPENTLDVFSASIRAVQIFNGD